VGAMSFFGALGKFSFCYKNMLQKHIVANFQINLFLKADVNFGNSVFLRK
jgi:hypothetical protein